MFGDVPGINLGTFPVNFRGKDANIKLRQGLRTVFSNMFPWIFCQEKQKV